MRLLPQLTSTEMSTGEVKVDLADPKNGRAMQMDSSSPDEKVPARALRSFWS